MIFGIEDIMRDTFPFEKITDDFVFIYRRSTHKHRLTAFVVLDDVCHNRRVFRSWSLVHTIGKIFAHHWLVCRDHHNLQVINLFKLLGFCSCRTGHAGKFFIHAEVILKRHRGKRAAFLLNGDSFFGFNRLVDTFAKPTTHEESAGKFINDNHLPIFDYVVTISLE